MSRNGSGTYTLPAGNPVVTGTTITTTWANTTLNDIASSLTGSVAADGQTPMSGSLNMANNRVISVLDPTSAQDAATKTYVDTADTTNLALTLLKANNLSDVASATTSRTNLGLGTIATQAASAVTITGGTLDGTSVGTTTRSSVKATTLDLGLAAQSVAIGQGNASIMKNRIINGAMYVAQRATSATLTAGSTIAAGYATVDRFYGYCTGANVTMAQVSGTGNNRNLLQFTGAASVTAIGCGQRIEAVNSYDMAGSTVTLSAYIANSLLTSVTWTAYYATTTDTFGTLASPTRTQIATGTFTVNSTLTQYNAQISVPSAATTGIEIVFTVGAQTSGTFQLGLVQLELGSSATGFEYVNYQTSLANCQRYFQFAPQYASGLCYSASIAGVTYQLPVQLRAAPTLTIASVPNIVFKQSNGAIITGTTLNSSTLYNNSLYIEISGISGLVQGNATTASQGATNSALSAEL